MKTKTRSVKAIETINFQQKTFNKLALHQKQGSENQNFSTLNKSYDLKKAQQIRAKTKHSIEEFQKILWIICSGKMTRLQNESK